LKWSSEEDYTKESNKRESRGSHRRAAPSDGGASSSRSMRQVMNGDPKRNIKKQKERMQCGGDAGILQTESCWPPEKPRRTPHTKLFLQEDLGEISERKRKSIGWESYEELPVGGVWESPASRPPLDPMSTRIEVPGKRSKTSDPKRKKTKVGRRIIAKKNKTDAE